ncbi:hypothetical protein [Cucumibacter marinus]|uniref:hypothetical protein n=1 Tax=Cucumibacter marinus TaxID=1121252 RepID=UPI000419E2BA|nr:hypothetical protein [Cucumibacter marinus]
MKANFTHARVPSKGNTRRDRHFVKGGNPRALQNTIPKANRADGANKVNPPRPGSLPDAPKDDLMGSAIQKNKK